MGMDCGEETLNTVCGLGHSLVRTRGDVALAVSPALSCSPDRTARRMSKMRGARPWAQAPFRRASEPVGMVFTGVQVTYEPSHPKYSIFEGDPVVCLRGNSGSAGA